jgi:hypothetical protein
MTRNTILKSVAATFTLAAALAAGPARADDGFKALAGVVAEPMSAADMEAVQGKGFIYYNGYGIYHQESGGYLQHDPGLSAYTPGSSVYYIDTGSFRNYFLGNQNYIAPVFTQYSGSGALYTTFNGSVYDYYGNLVAGSGQPVQVPTSQVAQELLLNWKDILFDGCAVPQASVC